MPMLQSTAYRSRSIASVNHERSFLNKSTSQCAMVGARDAVINENEPNCLWKFAGGERQIGTHVRKPTFRVAGERPGGFCGQLALQQVCDPPPRSSAETTSPVAAFTSGRLCPARISTSSSASSIAFSAANMRTRGKVAAESSYLTPILINTRGRPRGGLIGALQETLHSACSAKHNCFGALAKARLPGDF